MRIKIHSKMAEVANSALRPSTDPEPYPETSWTGDAPVIYLDDEQRLESIFRLFNRVDRGDAERLERMGYNLPSLSVGDVVEIGDRRWEVAGMGFEELESRSAVAARRDFERMMEVGE